MRGGSAVAKVFIAQLVKTKIAQAECGENKLAGNADVIHCSGPIVSEECAMGLVVFAQHDVFSDVRAERIVLLTLLRIFYCQSIAHAHA